MVVYTRADMPKELIKRILQHYGLAMASVQSVQKGYRNESYAVQTHEGRLVNLILYKREAGILQKIQNANRMGNFLATSGLPSRETFDERIVKLQAGNYVKYGALYRYLPGTTIPWEAYTMKHIKELGRVMSDLHAAAQGLRQENLPLVIDEYEAILARMQKYFGQAGVTKALERKLGLSPLVDLERYSRLMGTYRALPNQQALHMDFVRGNVLFADENQAEITGILDFEKAAWGHPAFDIARTLAFLLVDCKYKEEAKVRKYFLVSGYNKRGRSGFDDPSLLEPLVEMFLVYDFYKFLRHNPYDFLEQNEHFVRTRDFLLNRNIISKAKMLK